jgi:hypothetical protein
MPREAGNVITRSHFGGAGTPFPSVVFKRLMGMERLRQIALVVLFTGWMVPAFMAQQAGDRAARLAPVVQSHIERIAGIEPPPSPADRVVTMLRTIAALWFLVAAVYAFVLMMRFRRTLVS